MAGLDPAIHAHPQLQQDVDARDKPGHDELWDEQGEPMRPRQGYGRLKTSAS